MEAYNLPIGTIFHWLRESGAGRPGLFTDVGLHTYVGPRVEGGRANGAVHGALSEVVRVRDREYLFYPSLHVDVAIIRGTSADAQGNISVEHEPASLHLWDRDAGKEVQFEVQFIKKRTGAAQSVAFSSDGKYIASINGYTVHLWDRDSGKQVNSFEGHTSSVHSVASSPDGRYLASGSWDRTVRLWDRATGKEVRSLGHAHYVSSVAFSPDGRYLVSGCWDNAVHLWDRDSGEHVRSLKGHSGVIHSVAFSPDGKYIASGSGDVSIKIWDTKSGELLRTIGGLE